MFDLVHQHRRIAQVILFLIAIPFLFFGAYDYFQRRGDDDVSVATVGGDKISQSEFAEAVREQQERTRRALGQNFDPAMFENPEVRFAMLEQIVNQRVLERKAREEKFRVTDGQLQQFIAALPAFQDGGKFSPEKYRQMLSTQSMTPTMFEQRLRQDLLVAAVQEPVAGANVVARASTEKFLGLLDQQREVAIATVEAEPLARDIKIDDAQVKAFYEQNQAALQTPEQARIEYVVLSQDVLMAQTTVDPAEIRKQYEANEKQFQATEERSAAHVLVAVGAEAKDDEKAAAKQRADAILTRARANPAKFGELAKELSQDPGSALQEGDLGSFSRGTMEKTFEDAVFAAKVGDIVGPVRTDFGWHIIKINAAKAARTQSFDEVKNQIEADIKRAKAQQKFAAAADQFQNTVYEQADGLDSVAKALNLKVETTPLITRSQAQALAQGNPKFVQALFAPESIAGKRNTEAIEIAPNTLIAGRILDYKPAAPRPFDDVKEEIRRQLARRAATELAQQAGRAKLALLEQSKTEKEAGIAFDKPQLVSRNQPKPGVPPEALAKVFQANPDQLPAYVGAVNERGGFSLYKVTKVVKPSEVDATRLDAASARLSEQLGRELLNAYLATLKARADVKINQANLEKR
ncbi:MAG: SurA N-terminal domain-containing protein [Casimicrobiaceae bacterium]